MDTIELPPKVKIHVGDTVIISVLIVRGNKVQISLDAPKEVPVYRSEIVNPSSIVKATHERLRHQ